MAVLKITSVPQRVRLTARTFEAPIVKLEGNKEEAETEAPSSALLDWTDTTKREREREREREIERERAGERERERSGLIHVFCV